MEQIIIKCTGFLSIIFLGNLLKHLKVFSLNDAKLLARLVAKVTLPCALISSFSKFSISKSLIFLVFLGILFNLFFMFLGYINSIKKSNKEKAFNIINFSSYNIGSFSMPFIQSFVGDFGVVLACIFDVGNALMCVGLTPLVASRVSKTTNSLSFKIILKKLLSSPALVALVVMLFLSLSNVTLPNIVLNFIQTVANANVFLALFMIGIGINLKFDKLKLSIIFKTLFMRYFASLLIALGIYFFTNFSKEIKQILIFILFSPMASICVLNTDQINGDIELSSTLNSISVLFGVFILTFLMFIL